MSAYLSTWLIFSALPTIDLSALRSSCQLISCLLTSSLLLPHLLSSSQLFSHLLIWSQLFLSHPSSSHRTLRLFVFFSAPKPDGFWISVPKQPKKKYDSEGFWKPPLKKNGKRQSEKKSQNSLSQLGATVPMQFGSRQLQKTMKTTRVLRARCVRNSKIEQQWRSHSSAFASSELYTNMETRAQQQRRATVMQPCHCNLQAPSYRNQKNLRLQDRNFSCPRPAPKLDPGTKPKKVRFWICLKEFEKENKRWPKTTVLQFNCNFNLCETSLKNWKLEDGKVKLSCEPSLKNKK